MLIKELNEFILMSKYAGERFDLVQAGGGNTSVKLDKDEMCIKASGYLLSEINENNGYVIVDNKKILEILNNQTIINEKDKKIRDKISSSKVQETILKKKLKPSIETFLHALLLKYTLHVHSISVNILTSHVNWIDKVMQLGDSVLPIKYETPGIDLAIELKKQIQIYKRKKGRMPKVICLQNHGLIVTSNDFTEIKKITEYIVCKAEKLCNVNFEKFRNVTMLSSIINKFNSTHQIAYFVNDAYINKILKTQKELFIKKPFSPDGYVFCGYKILDLGKVINDNLLKKYLKKYNEPPKIVIYKNKIYIFAIDLKKAKMIEDVLKNNLIILEALQENINFLEDEEIEYLSNWEAEKFRQNL